MRTRRAPVTARSLCKHSPTTEARLAAAVLATLAASLPAQLQFDERRKRGLPTLRQATAAVALGDVDGDGHVDVVFGNGNRRLGGQQNRLHINDGNGTYIHTDATIARMPVDSDVTQAVALGDVDADGDLDIVFGNNNYFAGQQNRLYINDGTGTFSDETAARMPAIVDNSHAVALGDVDGDGDLDMVVGNTRYPYGQQNRLYLNDGKGTYTDVTAARLPVDGDITHAVALGDVDGDGDLDIVFGNGVGFYAQQNRLYFNDGDGNFTDATAARMPPILAITQSVALGDVDSDGDLDLLAGNGGYFARQNRLYTNDGTGTYTDDTAIRVPVVLDRTEAVALGDVDGDGDLDIIAGNASGFYAQQNRLYLNDGNGIYADDTAARMPVDVDPAAAIALGDVDDDGDLDLVFGNGADIFGQDQNTLYLNDGEGSFTDATAARIPAHRDYTQAVALGDVDGDGDLDMVLGNYDRRLYFGEQNRLYLNDGRGTYSDVTATHLPAHSNDNTNAVALGDVDGDGDLDIVVGNGYLGEPNRLYLNDGTGSYSDGTARIPGIADETHALALGDVDGDGDLDIVSGNYMQNRLFLNDGSGTFTDATDQRMPAFFDDTHAVALGDVDGDGDLDLVVGNDRTEQNRLLINDGSGTFVDATAARMPVDADDTLGVALGDVDADGDLDMVFANGRGIGPITPTQNRLYLNDGSGTFADATAARLPPVVDSTSSVTLGDIDDDGDLDLVFGNTRYPPVQNRLLLNDGTGTYTEVTAVRMPTYNEHTGAIALGDVDGDGDLDMAEANWRQNCLHLNLLRHLDAPFLLRVGRPFTLEAYARHGPASATDIAVLFLSGATASIPLPPLGTVGLAPAQLVVGPSVLITQPPGVGSVDFPVPNAPSLLGIAAYAQAMVVPLPFEGLARLTNVTADVILE